MPQQPPASRSIVLADAENDDLQRAAIECIIDLHPIQLTLNELIRELTDTPDDFASRDRIEIAIQHLARAGLVHRHGSFVFPTRALLRVVELDMG